MVDFLFGGLTMFRWEFGAMFSLFGGRNVDVGGLGSSPFL